MLIDAHCHLDDEQFAGDVDAVIERALAADVTAMVTAGADLASSRAAVDLAARYASVYAAVGLHPHHAETFSAESLQEIRQLAAHPKVVAIGEIGLDFHYADGAPREVQEQCLAAQLDLAEELGKPVVIHDRDAHAALLAILGRRQGAGSENAAGPPPGPGMLHCFSGDLALAHAAIALGYWVSFAGNLTFGNARELQAVARVLPLERLLVETDSPYLSPRRGRRNEPANVVQVAQKLAELLDVETHVVHAATRYNSEILFGLRTAK